MSIQDLLTTHAQTLEDAQRALATREFYSRFNESPSPRVYGETAAADGEATYQAYLGQRFEALADQPTTGEWVGAEKSPFGPELGVTYPELDLDAGIAAAQDAMKAWREVGPQGRAAVCTEMVARLNARSFEMAQAVMHTSGQPFVMAFQAGGAHAQDRALEAIAAALTEQTRLPEAAVWEKPTKGDPIRMAKEYRVVGRGVALVIGCNTFPTWNGYPGLFASLATGNPVVVKPHAAATLPLAITVGVAREVLAENGLPKDLVLLAAENPGGTIAADIAARPEVKIIDYTGGPGFGTRLEQEGAARGQLVYTEKAGVNTIVIDSCEDLRGMTGNLAFSFSLYTGQMCTAPQNVYIPRDGITAGGEHLSFEDTCAAIAKAVEKFTADDAKAVEMLGATVNDAVRERTSDIAGLAERLGGKVVLDSRQVVHPTFPDAVVRTPALIALDVAQDESYTQEQFGPVSFLIATDSTQQSLETFARTVREHGAMTAAVYSTSEEVLEAAREAAIDAGVALSENLTGPVFVNQTAAFSDLHGTGMNPAANAAYTDAAFVANRFRVVTTRRHV